MNYLIQEIEAMQKQIGGHEKVESSLAQEVDRLLNEREDYLFTLAHAEAKRDEALDLLADLQRNIP